MANRCSFLTLLLVLGCAAAVLAAKPVRSPQLLKGESPETNVVSEVTVGEALYARFDYIEYYGARLTEGHQHDAAIQGGFRDSLREQFWWNGHQNIGLPLEQRGEMPHPVFSKHSPGPACGLPFHL